MLRLDRTILILIILNVSPLFTRVTAITTLEKSRRVPNREVFYDHQSYKNTSLVYALCDKSSHVKKECTVVLENHYFDKASEKTECDVTFEVDKANYVIYKAMRVVVFGEDKAIILRWDVKNNKNDAINQSEETVFLKISIINFASCRNIDVQSVINQWNQSIHDDLPFGTLVVPHGDKFDVFFSNTRLCDGLCKETFDTDGVKINDRTVCLNGFDSNKSRLMLFSPLTNFTLDKRNVLYQDFSENSLVLATYKSNGTLINLADTLKSYLLPLHTSGIYGYSLAHDKIGVCVKTRNEVIECDQYDSDDKLILSTTSNFAHETEAISLFNLRGGGFLLLTGQRNICLQADCVDSPINYNVVKFDKNGDNVGSIELGSLVNHSHAQPSWAKFFSSRENECCVTFSSFHLENVTANRNDSLLDFTTKCFFENEVKTAVTVERLSETVSKQSRKDVSKIISTQVSKHRLFYNDQSSVGTTLAYGLCDVENHSFTNCSIVLEKHSFYKPTETFQCKFRDDSALDTLFFERTFRVTLFQEDKVILTWWEKELDLDLQTNLVISILHFPSCKSFKRKVEFDEQLSYIRRLKSPLSIRLVIYNDTLDIVYKHYDICKGMVCKITLDAKGKTVSGPASWLPLSFNKIKIISPIKQNSPSKGHSIIEIPESSEGAITVSLSTNDDLKTLRKFPYTDEKNLVAYSTVHNMFSICVEGLGRGFYTNCTQFDINGNVIVDTSFGHTGTNMAMRNLPNGGFILLTSGNFSNYYVRKVDVNGLQSNTLKIGQFECPFAIDKHWIYDIKTIFENEKSEYCVTFQCSYTDYSKDISFLSFTVDCFYEKDLTFGGQLSQDD